MSDDPKPLIVDYLLGRLVGDEAQAVEQRYISDQEFFDQVEAVERELIEDYAWGRLPEAERALVERRYPEAKALAAEITLRDAIESGDDA